MYGLAYTTLVWPGSFDIADSIQYQSEVTLETLLDQLNTIWPMTEFSCPRPGVLSSWQHQASETRIVAFWGDIINVLMNILQNRYFRRIWTVQEYTLSSRLPCAILGDGVFPLYALHIAGDYFYAKVNDQSKGRQDKSVEGFYRFVTRSDA